MPTQPAKRKTTSFEEVIEELQPHEKLIKFTAVAFAFVFVWFCIANSSNKVSADEEISQVLGTKAPCSSEAGGYGDVDGDGSVTVGDSQKISRFLINLDTGTTNFNDPKVRKRADVNGDRLVSVGDAQKITRFLIDLNLTFEMCSDRDGDGYVDGLENYIGTEFFRACGSGALPPDINNDLKVTLPDTLAFIPVVGSREGDGKYNKRFDLNGDGLVDSQDTQKIGSDPRWSKEACRPAPEPTVNLTVTPSQISTGQSVSINWTSTNTIGPCEASSSPLSWNRQVATASSSAHSQTLAEIGNHTFKLTCYGPGGKKEATQVVKVTPPPCTGKPVLSLSPSAVDQNGQVTITISGLANCSAVDTVHINKSTGNVWDTTNLASCILTAAGTCANPLTFTANFSAGSYSMRALLDRLSNGSIDEASDFVSLQVNTSAPHPQPTIGDPGKDAIREYIKNYVGGWNVRRTIGGYDLNFGRFLWGMAGCESGVDPFDLRNNGYGYMNPANWISEYEAGLFQYQHHDIPSHPPTGVSVPWSTYKTWNSTSESAGRLNANIWNYQHQVQVTSWKVSPGQGDTPKAWTCWNWWVDGSGRRNWTWFTDEWPDANF